MKRLQIGSIRDAIVTRDRVECYMADQDSMQPGVCPKCGQGGLPVAVQACPSCGEIVGHIAGFRNSDANLLDEASRLIDERRHLGLEGLIGNLECIVINTEPEHLRHAVDELLASTSLTVADAFEDTDRQTVVLQTEGSADVLVTSRKTLSPFAQLSCYPKSQHLPATRLEAFVFTCQDVTEVTRIQRGREAHLLFDSPIRGTHAQWIQTAPSSLTGLSIGWIERSTGGRSYRLPHSRDLNWRFDKPSLPFLSNIGRLDHAATRVRAENRDAAILEFMMLTNYTFDFAIHVKSLNSITNVARLSADAFAMVFTSGISTFVDDVTSGPTERFVHIYGPRTHHLAWDTQSIEDVFAGLVGRDQEFLLGLVGSPEDGLKQTFTAMSPHTLLINEYIQRFGDFDGFFTKSNVTRLTEATSRQ